MKKILLSLFTFVATTVAAFAGDNLVENGGFETWEITMPLVGFLQLQLATLQFHRAQMLTADNTPFW